MSRPTLCAVKICGTVREQDALAAIDMGAHAVGVNMIPASPRCVDAAHAARIVRAVNGRAQVVLVVANETRAALTALRRATGAEWLQLHGDESPADVAALLPHAYKAVRIGAAEDAARAAAYPGEHLLLDAKVAGVLGGSGRTFDWTLVTDLAARRPVTLAGGLTAENVADAVRVVCPFRVDVASGVEAPGRPREKDHARLRAFFDALLA